MAWLCMLSSDAATKGLCCPPTSQQGPHTRHGQAGKPLWETVMGGCLCPNRISTDPATASPQPPGRFLGWCSSDWLPDLVGMRAGAAADGILGFARLKKLIYLVTLGRNDEVLVQGQGEP